MNTITITVVITLSFISICDNAVIKFIYFDPSTTITAGKQDGVVILELNDGTTSTICMNNIYDNNNANVICKMMNYTGGSNSQGISIISSVTSSIGSALYQDIKCTGSETTLENCQNFVTGSNNFLCNNHNQDLHVNCYGSYQYSPTTMDLATCSASLTSVTQGRLTVTQNGVTAYFCNINRNIGPSEAQYLCKNTLCINGQYSRIVELPPSATDRSIGGFNNLSCTPTGCVNAYPFASDRCTPNSNIGIICTNDTSVMYPSPTVYCASSNMTVSWNSTIYNNTIANNYFAIQYANGSNCTNISVNSSVSNTVNLTAIYGTCDMIVSGDAVSINFIFRVIRMYPKVNNIITYPDEKFNVTCTLPRNQTVVQGPIVIQPVGLPPTSGTTQIPNVLTLWRDSQFGTQITDISSVPPGTTIFVKVQLINPPPNIILVLNQCYYGDPKTILINNRCPALTNVQIYPIDSTTKSFSFVLTQSVASASTSQVVCITSKCSTSETSCLSSCN